MFVNVLKRGRDGLKKVFVEETCKVRTGTSAHFLPTQRSGPLLELVHSQTMLVNADV